MIVTPCLIKAFCTLPFFFYLLPCFSLTLTGYYTGRTSYCYPHSPPSWLLHLLVDKTVMRFQDNLLLQKQQAEQEARQREAQQKLEVVAQRVNAHFDYWSQYRDPFLESQERIMALQKSLPTTIQPFEDPPLPPYHQVPSGSSTRSLRRNFSGNNGSIPDQNGSNNRDVTVHHVDERAELNPTAFNLYRKLKYGQ